MKNKTITLVIILLTYCGVYSGQFKVEPLSFEEGVSHNMVYSIIQDKPGFMWFGTMYGLIRYDGISYKKYRHNPKDSTSLSNDDIVTIFEDSNSNLWVGTYGRGLNFFDRKTDRFTRFGKSHFAQLKNWDGIIWDVVEDAANNIWFSTQTSGLVKLDKLTYKYQNYTAADSGKNNIASNFIGGMYYDSENNELYVGTRGGIIHKYDSLTNSFEKHKITIGSDSNFVMISAKSFDENTLAVGTQRGVLLFDKTSKQFSRAKLPNHPLLQKIAVRKIIKCNEEDEIWLATQRGVFNINTKTSLVTRLHSENENPNYKLSSNDVVALCRDNTGIYWAGNYLGGINKIHTLQSNITHVRFQAQNGLSSKIVNSFAQSDDNTLWIATASGLDKLDLITNEWKLYNNAVGNAGKLNSDYVSALEIDSSSNLWIGTSRGLNKLNLTNGEITLYLKADSFPAELNNFISALEISPSGRLFIGTNSGLFVLDVATGKFFKSDYDIHGSNILSLFVDSYNALWVGTFLGLNQVNLKTGSVKLFSQDPSDEKSISNNYVYSMAEDKSESLWLATGGGLNLFNRENDTFTYFTEQDGLSSSVITGVLTDTTGTLWLSTNLGITKFNPAEMAFEKFDTRDGLQSNMFRNNSCISLNNGLLAFGGINGFNFIDPLQTNQNGEGPKVIISSINVMGKEKTFVEKELLLRYNENFVEFNLAVLAFSNPSKNKYKYMLEGIDETWIESGEPYVKYTNLPPGNYAMKVLGADNFGNWSSQPVIQNILIQPPFWRTYWFYGLIVISLAVLLVVYHRKRISSEIKRRIELEKIRVVENDKVRKKAAADFHDELGHRITKISLFSEILKQHNKQLDDESLTYLNKISDMTKGLSSGVRDFIWTLDPDKDSLYEVAIRLKDFGDELFDKTGVSFTVEGISSDFEKVKLNMDWRRHLTLMFKEAMNNALKYAHAKNVSLSFGLQQNNVLLELNDDGKGIVEDKNAGNGLNNIKTRAKYLNSKLDINSALDSGTSIKFVGAFPH